MNLTQIQKDALLKAYNGTSDSPVRNSRECYSAIAQEYLMYKNRDVFYKINYDTCDGSIDDFWCLRQLTDENIADIKATIKQLDPNDEFEFNDLVNDCPEAFSYKDYLYKTGRFEEDLYVRYIDLHTKYYVYEFKVAEFKNGIEAAPNIHSIRISLTDEEYVYLVQESLAYKCRNTGGELTLDRLRTINISIFDKICNAIETSLFESNCYPYIVPVYAAELVEIDADAQILAEIIQESRNK